jgi:hypothetical protein
MRQRVEKQQETIPTRNFVTAMFHGSRVVLAVVESIRAREVAAQSLSVPLTDLSVVAAASSLPRTLNVPTVLDFHRRRTRRRAWPVIIEVSAERPVACSALAVSASDPIRRGNQAVFTATTKKSEQRCCAAA